MKWRIDDHRDGVSASRLSRRDALWSGTASLLVGALGAFQQGAAHAQTGDRWSTIARRKFREAPSVETFMTWTDALYFQDGDLEGVRRNLRDLYASNWDWTACKARVDYLFHCISSKDIVLTYTIPHQVQRAYPVYNLALPRETPIAAVKGTELRGARSQKTQTDGMGNKYLEVVPSADQDLVLEHRFSLQMVSYRKEIARYAGAQMPDECRRFLGQASNSSGTPIIVPNGARCQAIVRESGLLKGSLVERLEKVLWWGRTKLLSEPPGFEKITPDSEAVLAIMGGHCEHLAVALSAVARAVGIPTRISRGATHLDGGPIKPNIHSMTEYYLPGVGWILPDHAMPTWCSLANLHKYVYAAPGDAITGRLCFLEATEFARPWPIRERTSSAARMVAEQL